MSLLSEKLESSLMHHRDSYGRHDLHAVVREVKPDLTSDEISDLLDDVLYQRAKKAATKGKKKLDKFLAKAKTGDMFPGIERGYVLDIGGNYAKDADDLTEMEFKRIIQIRQDQLAADKQSLDALEAAYGACAPIWREHPTWLFGQCKAELARRARQRKGREAGK